MYMMWGGGKPDFYNMFMVVNLYFSISESEEKAFFCFPKERWALLASAKIAWTREFSVKHFFFSIEEHLINTHTPSCFHFTMSATHLLVIEVIQSDLLR